MFITQIVGIVIVLLLIFFIVIPNRRSTEKETNPLSSRLPRILFKMSGFCLIPIAVLGSTVGLKRYDRYLGQLVTDNRFREVFILSVIMFLIFLITGIYLFRRQLSMHFPLAFERYQMSAYADLFYWQKSKSKNTLPVHVVKLKTNRSFVSVEKLRLNSGEVEIEHYELDTSIPSLCYWCGDTATNHQPEKFGNRKTTDRITIPRNMCADHFKKISETSSWLYYVSNYWKPINEISVSIFFLFVLLVGILPETLLDQEKIGWGYWLAMTIWALYVLFIFNRNTFLINKKHLYFLNFGIVVNPETGHFCFSNEKVAQSFIQVNEKKVVESYTTTWGKVKKSIFKDIIRDG